VAQQSPSLLLTTFDKLRANGGESERFDLLKAQYKPSLNGVKGSA
jgi:hypothetical protein